MEQTIIEATTMEAQLKEVFEQHSTRQVLFVLGASFRKQKLYGRLLELMKNAGVGCTEFSDFQPNPKYESVVAGIEALRAHHCDFIIAAGGGSAMDVAKCIKLFSEMDLSKNCLEQEIVENALPLLAIPTTAGTGSEATRFAVIYYQGNKQSVAHPSCVPGWVLLEPELLESLPMYQRKATMLDAFCHAAESFWSVNSTEDSRKDAAEAIRLVWKYADSYLANEKEGNAQMLLAANIAIAITMLSYVMTFYTMSAQGVRILFQTLCDVFTGSLIPLPFMPDAFQRIVKLLPFGYMQDVPLRVFSGNIAGQEMLMQLGGQVIWLIILVIVGKLLMRRALKRVVVQGG